MTRESIRGKCQRLWIRALQGESITLQFEAENEMYKAKFALYDACRKAEGEIAMAKSEVEISTNKQAYTLTIRRRDANPMNEKLEKQLDWVLGEEAGEYMNGKGGLGVEGLEESMKRFQEKLVEGKGKEERPETPYFKREE